MTRILLGLLLSLPLAAQAAITHRFTGTAANAVDGGSHTPTLGGTTNAGDLITCAVTQRAATDYTTITASGYTTSYGKTNSNSGTVALLTKIAAGGDADPSISSSDTATGHTIISQCAVWAGALNTVTGIVAHSNSAENTGATSIAMPSLTVTTDNTLILAIGGKANDWNAENPIIGASDALTELGQPERTSSAQTGLVWAYRIQTTAANVTTGDVTLTENTANTQSIIVSLKAAAVTPLYTSDPAIQSRTTSSIVFRATTDTTGTRYGARLTDGSATPTCDQLEAQTATGGVQYGSQAATATVASDLTLGSITDGTVTDYYECLEDGSGNDSAVKAVANVYKTPAWTTAPSVTAQDDNDYTITKVLDGAGSCTAVACLKDSTAPSVAQVLAGNCTGDVAAIAAVTDASCEAGTATLGGALTRPIHDIYVAATYGSQNSALTTLADEMLDAPAGYQYDLLTSVSATSPCQELNDIPISPTIAATDVTKWTTATSPSGFALTAGVDCETQYTDASGSRQTATLDVYDTSAGDWMSGGPTTIYYNNTVPECLLSGCQYDTEQALINGVAMTAVDMATWFLDSDAGDTLAITTSSTGTGTGDDKIPAGTSIDGDGNWTGTPACASGDTTGSFTTTATDDAGDTEAVAVTWTCYDQVAVPNCVGGTLAACLDAVAPLNLSVNFTSACSNTVPALSVISQDPAATSVVDPFSTVDLVVAAGGCGKRRGMQTGLGIGIN